jgi:hypothetical protein
MEQENLGKRGDEPGAVESHHHRIVAGAHLYRTTDSQAPGIAASDDEFQAPFDGDRRHQ